MQATTHEAKTVGYSGQWAVKQTPDGAYFGRQINTGALTNWADTYEGALELVHAKQRAEGYSGYQATIFQVVPDLDPRHVEAYMRLQYGTLDHLDRATFDREARTCAEAVRLAPSEAEELAKSYGL